MNLGILTFHRAHNYGAMLQAYALKHILTQKGHNVEFISYQQPKIEKAYRAWLWSYKKNLGFVSNLKNLLSNFITLRRRLKRRSAFKSFATAFLPETRKFEKDELKRIFLDYDYVFFGSDQIWTTRFLSDFDEIYWGDIHLSKGKKVAYAPSMELCDLTDSQKEFVKDHLGNFDALSAREISMSYMLSKISGKEIPVVLDPTLLCSAKDYLPLIHRVSNIPNHPYLLVYQVGNYPLVRAIAKKLSLILHYPIIEISSTVPLRRGDTLKDCYAPDDFVALLANAAFVVSCSFHGTALSVLFKKQFLSILISGSDSRVISFLSQIGLMDRGVRDEHEVNESIAVSKIDYGPIELKLDELRTQSINYIDKSING